MLEFFLSIYLFGIFASMAVLLNRNIKEMMLSAILSQTDSLEREHMLSIFKYVYPLAAFSIALIWPIDLLYALFVLGE